MKFDADWREAGRWTYPPELVKQLGNYSLSGGVWRDGHLLVTGHDEPASCTACDSRRRGRCWSSWTRRRSPFSGQGIAHDPVTGGLVGIRRGKGVVFAVPEQPTTLPTRRR